MEEPGEGLEQGVELVAHPPPTAKHNLTKDFRVNDLGAMLKGRKVIRVKTSTSTIDFLSMQTRTKLYNTASKI